MLLPNVVDLVKSTKSITRATVQRHRLPWRRYYLDGKTFDCQVIKYGGEIFTGELERL
jgi:hypothetical protein